MLDSLAPSRNIGEGGTVAVRESGMGNTDLDE